MRTPQAVIAALLIALTWGMFATAPPARAAATDVTATPTALTGPTPVDAMAALPASGAANGTAQVLTQAFDPSYLRLGPTSQVTAPDGWATSYSADGTTFGPAPNTPTDWAAVRAVRAAGTVAGTAGTGGTESASVPPPPSAAFSGGGGGDGWNVFFDTAGHVFNIWHHNGSPWPGRGYGTIDCHTRSGGSCGTGWPFALTNGGVSLQSGMHSAGWVDTARGHLWFATNTTGADTGFACVDVSNFTQGPAWCGGSAANAFKVLGSGGPSGYASGAYCTNSGSPPLPYSCVEGLAVAGSRIYTVEARTGKILCLDMAAGGGGGAACAGQPYVAAGVNAVPWNISLQSGGGSWLPALMNVNGMIIGTGRGSYASTTSPVSLFCLSGDTGAACPGWSTPKVVGDGTDGSTTPWLTYAEPGPTGAINGVCVRAVTRASSSAPICHALDGSAVTGNAGIGSGFLQASGNENGTGAAATMGTRVYLGNGSYERINSRLYCWDAATSLACGGWPVRPETATGRADLDNYVITIDPQNDGCIWVNSDASGIYQYDRGGTRGCTGTPPASATFTATNLVAPQRVSCTAQPAWGSLSLTSPSPGTYGAATLTVLDAAGQVVVSGGQPWQGIPFSADGTLDLSGLAQADTGSNPQFVVNLTGRTGTAPFDPIATTLTSPPHPPQLCTTLTPQQVACPITGAPANSLLAWTSAITTTGTQAGTDLDPASVGIGFANAATDACAPPPPPPPPLPPAAQTETSEGTRAPTMSTPTLAPSGTTIVTIVSVSAPGVITQQGTRPGGAVACTSRAVTAAGPGRVAVTCTLTRATRMRLRATPVRVRMTTTLTTSAGASPAAVQEIVLRRRPIPVTG